MPRRAGLLGELEPLVRDLEGLDGDVGGAGDSEDVRQETQLEPAVNVRPGMGDHAGAQAPSPASEDSVQDTENRDLVARSHATTDTPSASIRRRS